MLLTPYARVSTTEQAKKYSIDTQLAEMEKYALDNGIELTRPHQEAKSASKTGENARPEFQRVLRDCLAGGSDGLLMCWFDRAFRNLFEFLQTKYLLRAKGKVMYLALQPMLNLEADDDDPYVTYIQNNFVNLAELQANIIGQKSRLGQLEKAKQGGWPGQTPIGYVRAEGELQPDPDLADQITQAFRAYATGKFTIDEWAAEAKKTGMTTRKGQPVAAGQWNKILKNEFYAGWVNWAGVRVQGSHQPLVDSETWERVQNLLEERGSPARHNHIFLLSGLLVSEVVGRLMVGTVAKGKYRYYEARASQRSHRLQADGVEAGVATHLVGVWWSGSPYHIAEAWLIALRGLDCAQMVPLLRSEDEKRSFLHRVIAARGVVIAEDGGVVEIRFRSGFERR
jgi:DNA invertase Pin-like site-specific DNA recombinase